MAQPIKRVLIANRGEIAVRIIRAAQGLEIETVQAVSAADKDSLAAQMADRAVVIGPAAAKDSYLRPELIVQAALSTGCQAIHPGYGFLSERARLATLARDNGLIFIGPPAETIEAFGDKLSARRLAEAAGVPLMPGSGKMNDAAAAQVRADDIGYPVVMKAAAGGGGRGMAVARSERDLLDAFDRLSAEAQEAFGDATLYLERYVENARHVEVQAFGDGEGRVLHFGERDCSVQRRYQKVVEEAPCTVMPDAVRHKLHAAATQLLASQKYLNAGTVEFLYDADEQEFYFIEVNTRIQVEHPVTEEVTGIDLVQLQFKAAQSGELPFAQDDIAVCGHAIECRINAEDPARGFLPAPGRITRWTPPEGEGIRIDTHCREGYQVPPFYDSMLAKLIVRGDDRDQAVDRMAAALDAFSVEGQPTNIPLLQKIVGHAAFKDNAFNTRWLESDILPGLSPSTKG